MKASPIQANFIGGEFSPILYGRVDAEAYATGLARCLNYVPFLQGPITRRPGTYFVQDAKNSGTLSLHKVKLVAFEFSNIQAYMLEFGPNYIRFYRNNGPVESSPGVPYEVTTFYDDPTLIHVIQSADVLYIFHPAEPPRKLTRTAHTNWTLAEIDFQDGPYLPQNVGAITLTPSATTGSITITASAAVFGFFDTGRLIRIKHAGTWGWVKITGVTSTTVVTATVMGTLGGTTAVTIWRLGAWSYTTGFPSTATFHEDRLFISGAAGSPQRIDGSCSGDYENFAPSAADGTITAASAVGFTINSRDVNVVKWLTSDEKGLLCGTSSGEWTIKAASSNEAMNATNIQAKKGSSYGSDTVQPIQVGKSALFVQRAGRKLRDMRYYYDADGFRAADLTILSEHITEGGLTQIAFQREPQQIVWGVRGDGVLLGMTYEREFEVVKLGWHRHILGGTAFQEIGHAKVKSIAVIPSADGTRDELWLAVERWVNGAYKLSIEYMTKFFENEDLKSAFFVDCGLTYDVPFTTFGGTFPNGFGTTTVIDNSDPHGLNNGDRVRFDDMPGTVELNGKIYLVANKTSTTFEITDLNGVAVDSTNFTPYAYNGLNPGKIRKLVSTVSGLSHLEGETVQVFVDGSGHPDCVVTGGAITLNAPGAIVHVGLGIVAEGQQLPQEAGATDGTAHGKTRRTHRIGFHLHRTLGLQYGYNFENLNDIIFRKASDVMGAATEPFSGIMSLTTDAKYDFENKVCWRQNKPYPGTILAIMPQMVLQDRG